MIAPFHHFFMLRSRVESVNRGLFNGTKNGMDSSRFISGSIEKIPQIMAANTSTSLIMKVWSVGLRSVSRSSASVNHCNAVAMAWESWVVSLWLLEISSMRLALPSENDPNVVFHSALSALTPRNSVRSGLLIRSDSMKSS